MRVSILLFLVSCACASSLLDTLNGDIDRYNNDEDRLKDMSDQKMLDHIIDLIRKHMSTRGLNEGFISLLTCDGFGKFPYWRDVGFSFWADYTPPSEDVNKFRKFEQFWQTRYPGVHLKMDHRGIIVSWDHVPQLSADQPSSYKETNTR